MKVRSSFVLAVLGLVACGGRYDTTGTPPAPVPTAPQPQPLACDAPAGVEVVVTFEGAAHWNALVSVGGWVTYGVKHPNADPSVPYTGALARVRTSTKQVEVVPVDWAGGSIASDGVDLFYLRTELVELPSESLWYWRWRSRPKELLARALSGGAPRALGPASGDHGDVRALRRGAVWLAPSGAAESILRWDGAATTTVTTDATLTDRTWFADAERVYAHEGAQLVATTLDGHTRETIATDDTAALILGADRDRVYETQTYPGALRAVAIADGSAQTLAAGRFGVGLVDGAWLYTADMTTDDGALVRVPLHGGAPEIVAPSRAPGEHVRAIAADSCALYWTVATDFDAPSVTSRLMRAPR